ncbi:MAG: hypothetical protein V9G19_11000 [Tetrasphaera sp.]
MLLLNWQLALVDLRWSLPLMVLPDALLASATSATPTGRPASGWR